VMRTPGAPHTIGRLPAPIAVPPDARVFALAAIARPERFFADLESAGFTLAGTMAFRDHRRFSRSDIRQIVRAAHSRAAAIVVTTEKDAVRLEGHDLNGLSLAAVPLIVRVEPAGAFRQWLLDRVAEARRRRLLGGAADQALGSRQQESSPSPAASRASFRGFPALP